MSDWSGEVSSGGLSRYGNSAARLAASSSSEAEGSSRKRTDFGVGVGEGEVRLKDDWRGAVFWAAAKSALREGLLGEVIVLESVGGAEKPVNCEVNSEY